MCRPKPKHCTVPNLCVCCVAPRIQAQPSSSGGGARLNTKAARKAPPLPPVPIAAGGDVLWVQCDSPQCLKWRMLPPNTLQKNLPELWMCSYHPDPVKARLGCDAPEDRQQPPAPVDLGAAKKHLIDHKNEERAAKKQKALAECASLLFFLKLNEKKNEYTIIDKCVVIIDILTRQAKSSGAVIMIDTRIVSSQARSE